MLARNPALCVKQRQRSLPQPGPRPARITTQHRQLTLHSSRRPGFTLVELLVTIVIIALLVGLLLPAVQRARIVAQEAKVISEIRQLESAIAAFKVKYGVEPPSQISLYRNQTGWDNDARSKGIIKRLWPQFDFAMTGGRGVAYPNDWGAVSNNPIPLNSGECLMFFLGGIFPAYPATGTGFDAPIGFAKSPSLPFAPGNTAREKPFLEFDLSRIRDIDTNQMPEYYDTLPGQIRPYLYFSSYEGNGYRVSELPALPSLGFTMVDIYRTSKATAVPGAATQSMAAQKPQTFQIISPGYDQDYGLGGVFNPTLPNAGLNNKGDYDNLTNLNGGRLNP